MEKIERPGGGVHGRAWKKTSMEANEKNRKFRKMMKKMRGLK